jgi:hypothetical protein
MLQRNLLSFACFFTSCTPHHFAARSGGGFVDTARISRGSDRLNGMTAVVGGRPPERT